MNAPSTAWRVACLGPMAALMAAGCGSKPGPGSNGEVGTYGPGQGPSFAGGDASPPGPLDASIEEKQVTVSLITLTCSGPCADVEAVATGGQPPYAFRWEDGSISASRHVCPSSSSHYEITVTDTGTSGEIARPAETATATLTADVIACPDGGGGASGSLCIANPSFEGTPAAGFWSFTDPSWSACPPQTGTPDVLDPSVSGVTPDGTPLPAASDGQTYVGLLDNKGVANSYVAQGLCAPVSAGATVSFRVDAARPAALSGSFLSTNATNGYLEVWGGTNNCAAGDSTQGAQLLWTSPELATTWTTYCVTVRPTSEMTSIAFRARADYNVDSATEIFVDHVVPVDACP